MAKLEKYQMYIGGEWTDPASGEWFESINPFTGKPWALFARGNAEDAGRAVAAAKKALNSPQWRDLTATGRGHLLRRLGDLIAKNADRLAEIEVKDNGKLIAESVIGAMLYFLKAIPLSAKMQEQKKWARVKISEKLRSLYNSRVTILGFGRIGKVIAERLKPFGCTITGIKRNLFPVPRYFSTADRIRTFENWQQIFAQTDHLICTLPGGEETDGILKPEHFEALPKSCYFYNVGRGNIYQESDLVSALGTGEIAGAYLDVFGEEPLPETSKLWEMENVLIQPHLSAVSPEYLELFVEELAASMMLDP